MEINDTTNPISLFTEWLGLAKATPGVREATAMALATRGSDGSLQNRLVLCKDWGQEGFTFYTNYLSRKGKALDFDPHASAVFYWDPLFRQVLISGIVVKLPHAVAETYWRQRPRESQLSGYISQQSEPVDSRSTLERKWDEAEKEFAGREIPCPEHWGGYLLQPKTIEFWIGQPGRLHDRFQFEKSASGWTFRRLYP